MTSTEQLKKFKEKLRGFSCMDTMEIYKIMSVIYHADIKPQQLIDSEITKSMARIALKDVNDWPSDEKRQKCVRISKKLLKQWKQTLGYEQHDQVLNGQNEVRKHIKLDYSDYYENNQNQTRRKEKKQQEQLHIVQNVEKQQEQEDKHQVIVIQQEIRDKAVQGLFKYLQRFNENCSINLAQKLEGEIYKLNTNDIEKYKNDTKLLVKNIDQQENFRQYIYKGQKPIKEILKMII